MSHTLKLGGWDQFPQSYGSIILKVGEVAKRNVCTIRVETEDSNEANGLLDGKHESGILLSFSSQKKLMNIVTLIFIYMQKKKKKSTRSYKIYK